MMPIIGGDWRYFYSSNINDYSTFPSAWDSSLNTGIGKSALGTLWINSYLNLTAFFSNVGFSWNIASLVFWILPAIFLSFFSAFYLFRNLFPDKSKYGWLAGIIYLLNTYFLMVLSGGQLGVVLAYSLVPLIFLRFIKLINNSNLHNSFIFTLFMGIQLLFDPRIVFVSISIILLYIFLNKQLIFLSLKKQLFFSFLIPFIFTVLLHSYWIIPLFLFKSDPLPVGFDNIEGLRFFSFANFENTISLLHPNWPENVFGKVYFMRPEFILLPIIAYISLLFINNPKFETRNSKQIQNSKFQAKNSLIMKQSFSFVQDNYNNKIIIFFALLGLIGAFLAKGTNDPLGQIYVWLFQYFPGFRVFRDPTKWYILVAISYSILIPYSINSICNLLQSKTKFSIKSKTINYKNIFLMFTILFLIFLIHSVFVGQYSKLKFHQIPNDYIHLKNFLVKQPEFFRTLWIPQWQRYGYFSNTHPAIGREELFQGSASAMIENISEPKTKKKLENLSVKYVIIPYDNEGEIFITDRKYDEKIYLNIVKRLNEIKWLRKVDGFEKVAVYELDDPKDHVYIDNTRVDKSSRLAPFLKYEMISSTEYNINVENVKKGDNLIFSESFDKNWEAQILKESRHYVSNVKYKDLFNSFVLPEDGSYKIKLYYRPQKLVNYGLIISSLTLISIICFLIFSKFRLKI